MPANTIWDFMTVEGSPAAIAATAPYASDGGNNYYELYTNSTRNSRKREHAINHCIEMAQYCYRNQRFPLGCDWLVAASTHVEAETQLLPRIFEIWNQLAGQNATGWPDLLIRPPPQLGKRLVGVTLFRIFESTEITFSREANTRFLGFIHQVTPDICGHLGIKDDLPDHERIGLIQGLTPRLEELMQPVIEASHVNDLESVLLRRHGIIRALKHSLVADIFAPHLPTGFATTTVPAVLKSVEDLVASQDTRFVEVAGRTRQELDTAISKLEDCSTFYALKYLLPLFKHLCELVKSRFESSDATKPASVAVEPYPRKYPFHAAGKTCRLRFEVHNRGPGPATEVELAFIFWAEIEPFEVQRTISELEVGRCLIDVDVRIKGAIAEPVDYEVKCSWRNYDSSSATFEFTGQLGMQNPNVDWDTLVQAEPYSQEAIQIDSDRPFIGRDTDLLQLVRAVASKSMGSAYVHGQKRVGKTSLALAAAKRAQVAVQNVFTIYLEGGDYVQPTAEGTLHAMGKIIARKISNCHRALDRIPLPEFTDALSPLNQYVDDVLEALPDSRWLLILDEFDELPLELYKRGPVGDGLFLTLRALSGRPRVGIILIGGEKMNPIIAVQGDQLNRFEAIRVDYFRKDDHWSDFQDLVRKPVANAIEYSDNAVEAVYRWSDGNPFFTNMVCKEILTHCYDRRDAFVSEIEVEDCANSACSKAGPTSFAHFWEDGILDTGPNVEEISIRRRKVLLALANTLRNGLVASRETLAKEPDLLSVSTTSLDRELKQFVERGVLTEINGDYTCRVFMFEQFLRERSAELISTEFTDQDERTKQEREENESYVTSTELVNLVEKWGIFVGKNITTEHVRAWLDQFGLNKDKRLMFQLLRATRFYSEVMVREKLRDVMGVVRRGTVEFRREGERNRGDLLVTYLGGVAKSGTQYARMFCTENKILLRNAVGYEELAKKLQDKQQEFRGIVIVDDIIGTGESAIDSLKEMDKHVGDLLRASDRRVFLMAVCGFDDARKKVEDFVKSIRLPVEIHVCDVLCESDKAFSSSSKAFANDRERLRAKNIAQEKGEELEKKWPLGLGDCQALVVFFGNCPNNTLPILRKNGKEWRALFPRT